ncbi:hypothetical protein DPMN_159979 [Dreissena polymorpha]|uniref:Uncharacterized protein n=1 Tax=Dreissena polymorpha TaxID=45954 RepID=A0A9D4EMM3_DREPO|nr:hypothetical protein DPMN_159979 [Dreissena polymorpha]
MLEVMGLLTLQQHEEYLFQFSSEQWPDPVGCSVPIVVKVNVDEVGGRDVAILDEMEADVSGTPADGSPHKEVGVETRIEEEDGISSTSADAHKAVIASES